VKGRNKDEIKFNNPEDSKAKSISKSAIFGEAVWIAAASFLYMNMIYQE